ncbi:oxygenase MpaB family protein [Saccharopolyspora rectivirgula]|uniref:oxygenase MpaB family protein n=1 Tax=Saccharopolyspora rectivirgula TaxID=28042 RepID=UPI000424C632|nr:oxygenase MpaB family protein [Saccharopolyspora rectivirgula]
MTTTADRSPQQPPSDTGLFGPNSVTWRIHTDPAMWIAAFSALALQSLHPRTMWGTYQNSALFDRRKAMARLFRTADFVAIRTFGTSEEVAKAGARVRRIHSSLTGIDERTGEEFRLDETENLLWVHCAEVYPYLLVARACGIPLTDAEADTYLDEQRRSAAVVGLDPERVPGSVAEMEEYFRQMRPKLELTDSARRGIRMWMNTPAPRHLAALRLVYPYLGALGISLLPGWARELYSLPGDGPAGQVLETVARQQARATRAIMLRLPEQCTGTAEQVRRVRQAKLLMRHART